MAGRGPPDSPSGVYRCPARFRPALGKVTSVLMMMLSS
jgi:hypothetical protein